jgi:hypothetical protein
VEDTSTSELLQASFIGIIKDILSLELSIYIPHVHTSWVQFYYSACQLIHYTESECCSLTISSEESHVWHVLWPDNVLHLGDPDIAQSPGGCIRGGGSIGKFYQTRTTFTESYNLFWIETLEILVADATIRIRRTSTCREYFMCVWGYLYNQAVHCWDSTFFSQLYTPKYLHHRKCFTCMLTTCSLPFS